MSDENNTASLSALHPVGQYVASACVRRRGSALSRTLQYIFATGKCLPKTPHGFRPESHLGRKNLWAANWSVVGGHPGAAH